MTNPRRRFSLIRTCSLIAIVVTLAAIPLQMQRRRLLREANAYHNGWVARIGSSPVPAQDYQAYLNRLCDAFHAMPDEQSKLTMQVYILDRLIDQMLLLLKADELGVQSPLGEDNGALDEYLSGIGDDVLEADARFWVSDADSAWRREVGARFRLFEVLEFIVPQDVTVSEEEIAATYETDQSLYFAPEAYHLSRILVQDRAEAEELLSNLKKRKSSFAFLATKYSLGPEATTDGDMGAVYLGALRPDVATAIVQLKPGECSGVLQVDEGCAIYRLEEYSPQRLKALAEVRDDIRRRLQDRKREQLLADWLHQERLKYVIEINFPLLLGTACESYAVDGREDERDDEEQDFELQ